MGQCAIAWDKFKERRDEVKRQKVDAVITEMEESMKEQKERFELKETEFAGQIKGTDQKITEVLEAAKAGKLKGAQARAFLIALKKRRKKQEDKRAKYEHFQEQVESGEERLAEMRLNTGLMKQHDKLVKGYKKLRKAGLDVGVAESKLDSVDDTLEDIREFNEAFKNQEPTASELSAEELAEIEAEVDADLRGGLEERAVDSIPVLKVGLLTRSEVNSDDVSESQLRGMVLDMS